jgi:PKD repeat protein
MRKMCLAVSVLLVLSAIGLPAAGSGTEGRGAPVANAGADQSVNVDQSVYFDGSGSSDPDSDPLTYSWDFDYTNGIQEDATGVQVSHTYTNTGNFRVTLTVSDGTDTDTDECQVTVRSGGANQPPTAVISSPRNGDVVLVGSPVLFDGSNSTDPDGDTLTYKWGFGDGLTGVGAKVQHTYTAPGVMIANLSVNDSKASNTAQVLINVITIPNPQDVNHPPKANAGNDKTGEVNSTITFVSLSQDSDGDKLDYYWDFGENALVDFINPEAEGKIVTHSYNVSGNYTVTHWVRENETTQKYADVDTCWANISEAPVYPPTVDAGANVTAEVNTPAQLQGSGKSNNDNGRITKYEWDFENDGVWDYSDPSTAKVKHTYTVVRSYVAKLRVTDEHDQTATDTTNVNITAKPNTPPTANAGDDQTVFVGASAMFHGTGSDVDGQIVSFQWDFDGDGVWDYENPSSGTATFTFTSPGTFESTMRVTDDRGGVADDRCVVSVVANQPPIANAGGDMSVECGETVVFDGTSSSDPENQRLTFSWDYDDSDGLQVDGTGPQVDHTYTKGGEFTATLTVTDELGKSSKDTAIITVVQTAGVSLASSPKSKTLRPGEEGVFIVTVGNGGNGKDTFTLFLSGDNYRWGSMDRSEVTLDAGSSVSVSLRVSPPIDAVAASVAKLTIRAVSTFDPNTVAQTQVTATCTQVYSIGLMSEKTKVEVETGKSSTFNVKLSNNGNGDDRISIKATGAAGKWFTITPSSSTVTKGSMKSVPVKVEIPGDATAQDYQVTLTAYAGDNSTVSSTIITLVVKKGSVAGMLPGFSGIGLLGAISVVAMLAVASRRRIRN